ncbi:spore germination protein [Gorillibacterium sp. sgz5001074]|uniref:spore germination protein n=1 Tax=Gorillibacterium sp. sgz5001074 TaxID=3446695 RepID=UPI003F6653BC
MRVESAQIRRFIEEMESAGNDDLVSKELRHRDYSLHLLYLRSICDAELIRKELIRPFADNPDYGSFALYVDALPEAEETGIREQESWIGLLYSGHVLLFGSEKVWGIRTRFFESSPIGDARVETVLQGPQDAFSGSLDKNINLLRNRYKNPSLIVKKRRAGRSPVSQMAMLYDGNRVRPGILAELESRLEGIGADMIQSLGQLQRLLNKRHIWTPFPNMLITERPDRTVLNLDSGKVVLLLEGDNFALIAPTVFLDFFSSMDDVSQRKPVAVFLNTLRSIALFIAVTLPAFYVAVASHNPELLRIQLALVMAGTRASVPYPPNLELLFMLAMMELLSEASVRLPKAIGPAATTVGGLILGQAAISAGLVGDIMIIITAAVAISNFTVPVAAMSFAVRILKYPLVLLASLFGLNGILVGLLGLLMYLVQLTSFGEPYFRLFQKRSEGKGEPAEGRN